MLSMISLKALTDVTIVLRSSALAGKPSFGGFCTRLSATDLQFMPCSASKVVIPVSASGVQFHTSVIMGIYKWNYAYWSGDIALRARPTNSQTRSLLVLGLCARVFVLRIPNRVCRVDIAVERNSLVVSE